MKQWLLTNHGDLDHSAAWHVLVLELIGLPGCCEDSAVPDHHAEPLAARNAAAVLAQPAEITDWCGLNI